MSDCKRAGTRRCTNYVCSANIDLPLFNKGIMCSVVSRASQLLLFWENSNKSNVLSVSLITSLHLPFNISRDIIKLEFIVPTVICVVWIVKEKSLTSQIHCAILFLYSMKNFVGQNRVSDNCKCLEMRKLAPISKF